MGSVIIKDSSDSLLLDYKTSSEDVVGNKVTVSSEAIEKCQEYSVEIQMFGFMERTFEQKIEKEMDEFDCVPQTTPKPKFGARTEKKIDYFKTSPSPSSQPQTVISLIVSLYASYLLL